MYFTVEKIENQLKEIKATIARGVHPIESFKVLETGWDAGQALKGVECPEFDDSSWDTFLVGSYWGGYDRLAWFRTWLEIPEAWRGHKLALRFLAGPRDGGGSTAEAMLYINGSPVQGIDVWHSQAWLPPEYSRQERVLLAIKAWSGVLDVPERRHFKTAELLWIDEPSECFFYLADNLLRSIKTLDPEDLRRAELLRLLNDCFHQVDFLEPRSEAYYSSLALAESRLRANVEALQTLREIKPHITGIGHAHIDMAWLWRLCHTREKAARTFTTALHLMRQYPEYRFMHSSPQLYKFLKQDYPEIYARVKEKIASGQWEITEGMWVEADTNLTGGESLVRQFLLGMRFAREEFGVEMKTLWLPDVFGYSAALPQIITRSGLKYFVTSKISWNQFNRFPADTFHWRGLDGSQVLTHFVTTPDPNSSIYTYNSTLTPEEIQGTWRTYQQKGINHDLLVLYGWGDGGGGPTQGMLETAQALRNLPGMPEVSLEKAEDYLERLEENLTGEQVPVWDGELYLEYHRGTYTSQAQNKRSNRQAEILYHNAEWASALAGLLAGSHAYPAEELRQGWEMILLNQFHDILPGSSIHPVYEDSQRDYREVRRLGESALGRAQTAIRAKLAPQKAGLLVLNPLSWSRGGMVELPWQEELAVQVSQGAAETQVTCVDGQQKLLVQAPAVPSLGYRHLDLAAGDRPVRENELRVEPGCLENRFYQIELNASGQIASLWDRLNQRQVLPPGKCGNVFQAFEDKPMNFDAWDIDIYYQEKMRVIDALQEAGVEEAGPLRGTLRLAWKFNGSTIVQRLTIYRDNPRIDFRTQIDWQESRVLLKAAFPVDVRATRATYEIQFGNVERPTHWNTSWDSARFEVPAHKWVDLSEGDYGVALLNDCKYGHDVKDQVMRLTLLKSAISPDPQADKGQHTFTYSLLPHRGDWRSSPVVQQAYELNYPLLASLTGSQGAQETAELLPEAYELNYPLLASFTGSQGAQESADAIPEAFSLAEVESDHVILETVKQAEEGDAWIFRVYEYRQCRSERAGLKFGLPVARAVECNLMEEDERPVEAEGEKIVFSIRPYEIKTFKVWFG